MTTDVHRALADLVDAGAVDAGTRPAEVPDLVVTHARSLDGIEDFTSLETLSLLSCAVGDYAALAELPTLRVLAVETSDLAEVGWARGLGLQVAVLRRNRIRDATAVVGLPGLQVLDLSGNPLDRSTRAAARSRRGPLVTVDDDELADVNVALSDAGLPVVGYRLGDAVWACANGLDLTDHPEAGHVETSIADLLAVARGERSARDLLGLAPDESSGTDG